MFKPTKLSDEIASGLQGQFMVKTASIRKDAFAEAIIHLNEAVELLERTGESKSAILITGMLEKLADEASPFAEHEVHDVAYGQEIAELQNQINVLSTKDELNIRDVLMSNDYEVTVEGDAIYGHKIGLRGEPTTYVVVTRDTEPGMEAHWTVDVDDDATARGEQLTRAASSLVDIGSNYNNRLLIVDEQLSEIDALLDGLDE